MTHNTEIEDIVTHLLMATNAYGYFSEKGITSLRQELGEFLHHQLQKAREEAVQEFKRKATKSFIMYINDAEPGFNDPQSSYIENSFFSALDHSELDQDKNN